MNCLRTEARNNAWNRREVRPHGQISIIYPPDGKLMLNLSFPLCAQLKLDLEVAPCDCYSWNNETRFGLIDFLKHSVISRRFDHFWDEIKTSSHNTNSYAPHQFFSYFSSIQTSLTRLSCFVSHLFVVFAVFTPSDVIAENIVIHEMTNFRNCSETVTSKHLAP